MNYISVVSFVLVLVNVILLVALASFFIWHQRTIEQIENRWREREWKLTDALLKQAHVKPLVQVESAPVVKIPDPEALPPLTWLEQCTMEDMIKEEIEQIYPEAARMSAAEAKVRFAHEWRDFERKAMLERVPLKA